MADWRTELVHAVGGPASARMLSNLDLWARSEGQPVALHNPLGAAIWDFNRHQWVERDTVIQFNNVGLAVAYYTRLLNQAAFRDIALAIDVNASSFAFYNAVHDSPWRGATYQNRHYPVLLYRHAITPPVVGPPPVPSLSAQAKDIFHAWSTLAHELRRHTPTQLARARRWSRRMHSAVK